LLVPRLLPRIAIVFAALWLVRNLAVAVPGLPSTAALWAPFQAPLATGPTTPGDDWQVAFKDLERRLGAGDDVSVQPGDRGVAGDRLLWWSSYWLFPHHVHLLTAGGVPASTVFVVVVTSSRTPSSGEPAPPAGYSRVLLSTTWPGGAMRAYRRD
jgi:hypothetical protein